MIAVILAGVLAAPAPLPRTTPAHPDGCYRWGDTEYIVTFARCNVYHCSYRGHTYCGRWEETPGGVYVTYAEMYDDGTTSPMIRYPAPLRYDRVKSRWQWGQHPLRPVGGIPCGYYRVAGESPYVLHLASSGKYAIAPEGGGVEEGEYTREAGGIRLGGRKLSVTGFGSKWVIDGRPATKEPEYRENP